MMNARFVLIAAMILIMPRDGENDVRSARGALEKRALGDLTNGNFERGKDGVPEGWKPEGDTSRIRFTWEPHGGIDGSRCVSISSRDPAVPVRGAWTQTVQLAPYTPYLLKGFIKGRDLQGLGRFSAVLGASVYRAENGPQRQTDALDWTPFEMDFATGPSGHIQIYVALGLHGRHATGTVWFDNLTLQRNPDVETFESKHFILHLYKDQVALATRAGVRRQMANVDALCEAYAELTGYTPPGGKQSAFSPSRYRLGALAWAGNPLIFEKQPYLASIKANWPREEFCAEVFLHELAHNFDHPNWTFHVHFNELKMFYALETRNLAIAEDGWTRGAATRHRWEFRTRKNRELGIVDEQVQVYKNILLRDKIGWEPFKKTFRYFLALTRDQAPRTPWGKFKLWHDKLGEYSGFDAWSVYRPAEVEFVKYYYAPRTEPVDIGQIGGGRHTVNLTDVKWDSARVGWQQPAYGFYASGAKLHLHSIYGHAPSQYNYTPAARWKTLATAYGLARGNAGSVVFVVKGDGRDLFRSALVKDFQERPAIVDISGVKSLALVVEDGGDGRTNDWGIWFDPKLQR